MLVPALWLNWLGARLDADMFAETISEAEYVREFEACALALGITVESYAQAAAFSRRKQPIVGRA